MNRLTSILLMLAAVLTAAAVKLDGAYYEGIAKLAGQGVDYWVTISFDDEDALVSMAGAYKFTGAYKQTVVGKKSTVSFPVPGSAKATLTSADGGETYQGTLPFNGQNTKLWLLKVPRKKKPATLPADQLDNIVGSPDGYTAFIKIEQDGGLLSATSEFMLNAADHTFSMTCDSPAMQKIFSTMSGIYRIDGNTITLTDATGNVVSGKIYEEGNYLSIPLGSGAGMNLSLILIR